MHEDNAQRQQDLSRATDIAIRIGTLSLLAAWCFVIVSPFLLPIAWGVIIAIALHGPFATLCVLLGGRAGVAASVMVVVILAIVIVPSALIGGSLADDVESLARAFQAGELRIPPPSDKVATWPVIGARAYQTWLHASQDLDEVLSDLAPRMQGAATWLLATLAQFGLGILQFIFSTIISGIVLAGSRSSTGAVRALASRLIGARGPELVELATATVRGVTRGILGVALIQGMLAGTGLFLAGVPGAALWSVVALILGVVQISVGLVMLPAAIWLFAHASTTTAVAFAVWAVLIAPLDNVLKPLLMGRGLRVPVMVVFVGAIGGFVTQGIIGLFVGAVVLVVGFELCRVWLAEDTLAPSAKTQQALCRVQAETAPLERL